LYALLVRAELARGEPAAAADWLRRAENAARGLDLPLTEAAVLHARALVLLHDDRPHEAADLARLAVERAGAVGAVLQGARSRMLFASALARAGNRTKAIGLLREAEAQFVACGAQRLRDEALRELRRMGLRSIARQRRGPGGEGLEALTGREREICELVARGHTNREIAAQVFLSAKTVEGHLTNIFAKLRVGSRAEVAEAVGRARTKEP
jgi:DNA-binding NarL/FixJ family response regulator